MRDLNFPKLLITALTGIGAAYLLQVSFGLRPGDALMIIAAVTITASFTFIHTQMGNRAAGSGSMLNQYVKIRSDLRYNVREPNGYVKETLLVGIIELAVAAVLLIRQA